MIKISSTSQALPLAAASPLARISTLAKRILAAFSLLTELEFQNYMNDAPVDIGARFTGPQVNPLGPQVVPQGGTLQPPVEGAAIPVFGMSTFLDHTWSKKFTSSFGYSMLNMENTSAQSPGAYRQGKYFIAKPALLTRSRILCSERSINGASEPIFTIPLALTTRGSSSRSDTTFRKCSSGRTSRVLSGTLGSAVDSRGARGN
jgi:hypothetical protein